MRWWVWPLLLLIVIVAIRLRAIHWDEPLWIDELHTSWCTTGSWGDVGARARLGNQGPLYFAWSKLLVAAAGESAATLRATSWLSGLLLVIGLAVWVGTVTRSPLALLVTGLWLAVDSDAVFYSGEARPYALVMLFFAVHVVCLYALVSCKPRLATIDTKTNVTGRAANRPWPLRVCWILSGAVTVYLHSTALLLLVIEMAALGALLSVRAGRQVGLSRHPSANETEANGASPAAESKASSARPSRPIDRIGQSWLLDVVALVILLLPIVPQLMDVGGRRMAWSAFVNGSWSQAQPILRLALFCLLIPLLALAVDRGVGALTLKFWRRQDRPLSWRTVHVCAPAWFVLSATLAGVWCVAAILTYLELAPILLMRYLAGTIGMSALVAGLGVGMIRGPWLRLGVGIVLIGLLATDRDLRVWWVTGQTPAGRVEGWDLAAELVNRESPEDWSVLLFAQLIEERGLSDEPTEALVDYCRFPLTALYRVGGNEQRITPWDSAHPERIPAVLLQQLESSGGMWIVVRDHPVDPTVFWRVVTELDRQLGDLDAQFSLDRYQFGAVHVLKVRRLGGDHRSGFRPPTDPWRPRIAVTCYGDVP